MAKEKKRFGNRGFTADDTGALAEVFRSNARLVERVAARRKARGDKPDTNRYVPLDEGGAK